MNKQSDTNVKITKVSGKREMDTFIRIPWEIYKNDPNWVPPLILERKEAFSSNNPFFKHTQWQAWIAWQNGKPVGRISAQIDELHQKQYENKTGFFGLIEAVDNPEVFKALLDTAENWLKARGMQEILGPFNLGINQEVGILIEGFDSPPYVMTPHSLPYYGEAIEQCGYQQTQDLVAYELNSGTLTLPRIMQALLTRSADRVKVRPLQRKQRMAELEVIRDIFNDAWENNWNFVPFTQAEFAAVGKELLMLLPDEFIQIAELDGEAAAFIVLIPNINEAIADLNGRLLPFGWARLLWRLKVKFPKSARVALMGVRQKYQNTRFGPALAYTVVKNVTDAGVARGLERVEMSWVLDNNHATRNIIESVGGEVSKRYRMYEKDL